MLGDMGMDAKEAGVMVPTQYVPPTIREQLTKRKEALTREIEQIDNVIGLLDAAPGYEKIHDGLSKLRGLR